MAPNNPLTKKLNPPFIYIDIKNDISDEITKKPRRKMDKINIDDKLSISNNSDLLNTNYIHEIIIKKNNKFPKVINKFDMNLPLIKISKKNIEKLRNKNNIKIIENTNDNLINKNISSFNEEIIFNQTVPNNVKRRNIINPLIEKDEINCVENIKNLKNRKNKINIIDKIEVKDLNIKNNKTYDYSISKNNLKLIPKIITNEKENQLSPVKIDLFKFGNKYCLVNENSREKKDINEITKDFLNIKYDYKNLKHKENLPLLFNNYQISEINTDKIRYKYKNTITNEKIMNNIDLNLEDETINIRNKNNIYLPTYPNRYIINQIPEKIKEQNKIELSDKIDISSEKIDLYKTKFILSADKKISNIPKLNIYSFHLNPLEINLPFKKFFYREKPKENKKLEIKMDYIIEKKPAFKDKLNQIQIINNDYQIYFTENIKKPKVSINTIQKENIIKNNICLFEEEKIKKFDNQYKLLNLPKTNILSLKQKPENIKIFKVIDIQDVIEEINKEKIKLNRPYKRKNMENKNIIKDEILDDLEEIRKKFDKVIDKKINIIDRIKLSNNVEIMNEKYEIKNENQKLINLVPKIKINEYPVLNPIIFSLKLKQEKINSLEIPKEILYTKNTINHLNIKFNHNNIGQKDDLPLLYNNYQLSGINIDKIRQNHINIIENEKIRNNKIIDLENETISVNNKNKLNLPKHLNRYNINQIPEKIKEPNKIELPDKIVLMNNLTYQAANYSYNLNKKEIIIPNVQLYSSELNLIEIQPKYSKKLNYLESPLEHKTVKINREYIIKAHIAKNNFSKNDIIPSEYELFIPKPSLFLKTKNTINNEYILSNTNSILSLLKEEVKFTKNNYLDKFPLPKNTKLHLIQKPEKLKKQKIINVPDNSEEINLVQIKPNKTIKRKPKDEKIIKDEIFEDLRDMKNKYKKQIKPINMQDNFHMSDNLIESLNTNYEKENVKNKVNKYIPKVISNQLEVNLIKIEIKLNLEKINTNEKQKEIKDIKIKSNYYNKNLDYKSLIKEDKLPILGNNYQLTNLNIPNENMQKKRNILRSKKSMSKDIINTIENEEIKNNNISLEAEIITNKINLEKPKFILNPIVNSKLIQKPEKATKLLNILNETEEISNKNLYINNPIKRGKKDNIYIIKDETYNDMDNLKKNLPKKLLIKCNIIDKINLSENIVLLNPEYDLNQNKEISA